MAFGVGTKIHPVYCEHSLNQVADHRLYSHYSPRIYTILEFLPSFFDINIPLFSNERNEKLKLVFDLSTDWNRLSLLTI